MGGRDRERLDASAETIVQDRLADERRDLVLVVWIECAFALLTAVAITHFFFLIQGDAYHRRHRYIRCILSHLK